MARIEPARAGPEGFEDAGDDALLASARRQLEVVTRAPGASQARLREMQAHRDSREARFTGTVEGRLKEVGDARPAAAFPQPAMRRNSAVISPDRYGFG